MNKIVRATIIPAIAAFALATPAMAEDWDFVLTNNTGKAIKTIEVGPAGSGKWQANKVDPDQKREAALKNGLRTTVHFDKGTECKVDVKATFDDGASAVWSNINVCDNSFVVLNYANGTPTFKLN